jgi:methylase of polypeptide subunit release factors
VAGQNAAVVDQAAAARVRGLLLDAGYTAGGVLERVGSAAFDALGRGLGVPIRRALAAPPTGSVPHLDGLIRLLLLGDPLPAAGLPSGAADDLVALALVRVRGADLVPLLEVRPYGEPDTDWYLVADLGTPVDAEHVLGAGGASLTLARITPRVPVDRALDLGCGSGVQVLHATRHARTIVATDTNARALRLTALSAALSGVPGDRIELRAGSLFAPVAGERFDLVVSNPPFVISPGRRFTYRDAGLSGDALTAQLVRQAAAHLAPGGRAAILGNWMHVVGEDWRERVGAWVAGTGVSAWIAQRDAEPVADYAAMWLRDAGVADGPALDAALQEWLVAFAALRCEAVGFGWVVLVAPGGAPGGVDGSRSAGGRQGVPWAHVEDLSWSQRLPSGDEVLAFLDGCARVEALPAPALLAARVVLAEGATITRTEVVSGGHASALPPRLGLAGAVGPGGWRPAVPTHPALLAALLGPATASVGAHVDAWAQAEGLDPIDVLGPVLTTLRELVRLGIVRTV